MAVCPSLPWPPQTTYTMPRPAVRSSSGGEGEYPVSLGELIASPNSVYEVLDLLGRGTFGQVLKCVKTDKMGVGSGEVVAMKVLKDIPSYAKQGQVEIGVLTKLSRLSADEFNFVRAYESFQHRKHICIVFELLQINLYDYLKQCRFQPMPLKHIRPIAQQVLSCLAKLKELGLVHADLKPENIMLVDPERQPFRVKVIDFGSATPRTKSNATTYLQSRYYRAPEVILGLPYSEAIDMWSLGCVLAELYLGWPLFPGSSEFDQISFVCQTVGVPPESMLRNISKASRFFTRDPLTGGWSLKSPQQFEQETHIQSKETRKYIFKSIAELTQVGRHGNDLVHQLDCMQFVSLLAAMLTFDPASRITPTLALQAPFTTMQHLATHTNTPSVREWIQCMQVCCHARTTASFSPMAQPPPFSHPYTLPPPLHPHPAQLGYHIAPSTLAYYPPQPQPQPADCTLHQERHHHSWCEIDRGYVSADSSPASHVTMDALEVPVFFVEPPPPPPTHMPAFLHPHTPHLILKSPSYGGGLYPCALPLVSYSSALPKDCLTPYNPFSRL